MANWSVKLKSHAIVASSLGNLRMVVSLLLFAIPIMKGHGASQILEWRFS